MYIHIHFLGISISVHFLSWECGYNHVELLALYLGTQFIITSKWEQKPVNDGHKLTAIVSSYIKEYPDWCSGSIVDISG